MAPGGMNLIKSVKIHSIAFVIGLFKDHAIRRNVQLASSLNSGVYAIRFLLFLACAAFTS
jgi:hypothetical protein